MTMSATKTPAQNGIDENQTTTIFPLPLTPEQRELFERAAEYHGRSLADFLVSAAMTVAEDVFYGPHSVDIQLSPAAYEQLLAYIDNPGEPNERLREAFRRYDEMFGT
jgi:uncharacterized protein (DUF1778 family)